MCLIVGRDYCSLSKVQFLSRHYVRWWKKARRFGFAIYRPNFAFVYARKYIVVSQEVTSTYLLRSNTVRRRSNLYIYYIHQKLELRSCFSSTLKEANQPPPPLRVDGIIDLIISIIVLQISVHSLHKIVHVKGMPKNITQTQQKGATKNRRPGLQPVLSIFSSESQPQSSLLQLKILLSHLSRQRRSGWETL